MADWRVPLVAADQRHLVPVDLGLPLAGRPFQAVDRGAGGCRFDPAFRSLAGIVADVVGVRVCRGLARERVLVAEPDVVGIG